jgi:phenylacetate-CoA ligase
MFETGVRQIRLATSMVLGRRIDPRNVARLVDDALQTLEVFGAPGDDTQQMLDGPFADPAARKQFQDRALRRTARWARSTVFYEELFTEANVDPDAVSVGTIDRIPLTSKRDLVARGRDFLARGADPYVSTRTTGTTGRPVEVWLSRYEAELWPAIAALAGLLRGEISPADCMQINISSRATAAVHQNVTVCRLAHARTRVLGVVPPAESLESLLDGGGGGAPTLLSTYPSYLAHLVHLARARGHGPEDFLLRRIDVGGEVLSPALSAAATDTFGAVINDTFAMTEVLPVSGRVCEQGHLHHDLNMGYVEVLALDGDEPAAPGELGRTIITPYYPYRECMPVLRYDTGDLVRVLPEEPLTCTLAGTPATSRIMGKAGGLLPVGDRLVTTRDLVEALEALPHAPWPVRFAASAEGGRLLLTVPRGVLDGVTAADVASSLVAAGLPAGIVIDVVPDGSAQGLRPVRADLIETTFTDRRA